MNNVYFPQSVTRTAENQVNTVITLADLKQAARVDTDDEDAYLMTCVHAAVKWVEGYLARSLNDVEYKVTWVFPRPPAAGDELWLPVAPVSAVALSGGKVTPLATADGFSSFVSFEEGWDPGMVSLDVTVEWGEKLADLKLPVTSLAAEFYRDREFQPRANKIINRAILNSLNPYRREI